MTLYQIRVLQPAGSLLASDIARLLLIMGGTVRIRHRRARTRGHVLVYIDITSQKGQDQ